MSLAGGLCGHPEFGSSVNHILTGPSHYCLPPLPPLLPESLIGIIQLLFRVSLNILETLAKGSFTNYVDKILLFFDHLPTCVDIFYGKNVDKKWTF